MTNKRIKLSVMDILSKVKLPLLPGDIVTTNIYFPKSSVSEHFKVLSIWHLEVPYITPNTGQRTPSLETWANVEIVRSPGTPAAVGIQMSEPVGSFRRVEERSVAGYIQNLMLSQVLASASQLGE